MPNKNDYTKATNELETFAYYMSIPYEERGESVEDQIIKVIYENTPEGSDREGFRNFLDEESKRMSGFEFADLVEQTLRFTSTISEAEQDVIDATPEYEQEKEFIETAKYTDVVYSVVETVIAQMKQIAMQEMVGQVLSDIMEPADEKAFDIDEAIEEMRREALND
jgi:hypothetical protein